MDTPSDYLAGPFREQTVELHRVRDRASAALNTLESFGRLAKWPYEIADGRTPEYSDSHSTSAMILFSMGITAGSIFDSVLVPDVVTRNQSLMPNDIRETYEKIRTAFSQLLTDYCRHLGKDRRRASRAERFDVSWSSTFGADDPFTLLWVLEMLRPYKKVKDCADLYARAEAAAKQRVADVLAGLDGNKPPSTNAFKTPRVKSESVEHAFPTLRVVQLYDHLTRWNSEYNVPSEQRARLLQYLSNRLHMHLSYSTIPDSSYCAAELAFSLEGTLILDNTSLDAATVDRCLEVLLDSQLKNAYWRPLRPFLATKQGMALLPLSVEIGNSLLRTFDLLERRHGTSIEFIKYHQLLHRYTDWLMARAVEGSIPDGRNFFGWHSEHTDDPGKIHCWETSQVLIYLLEYEAFLRKRRAQESREKVNLRADAFPSVTQAPFEYWSAGKDAPQNREPVSGLPAYEVYKQIGLRFIKPRSERTDDSYWAYSMLLYGPQGTGKTSIAERVAESLGYPLISISPSDFVVAGSAQVEARAKAIFDVLVAQVDAVILLDEIDRLILDRDSKRYADQSDIFQLMTPGMLPKLATLRRTQRSIFIVSTNYAEAIDPAIKRKGRIDEQYLVLPPDEKQRAHILGVGLRKGRKDIPMPTEEQLRSIAKKTALFIPGELFQISIEAALQSIHSTQGVVTLLEQQVQEIDPTIRLTSYEHRLGLGGREPALADRPISEFLLLVYLLRSSRHFTAAEQDLWSRFLRHESGAGRQFSALLATHVKDPEARKRLEGWALDGGEGRRD